jgi:hypothetical protein
MIHQYNCSPFSPVQVFEDCIKSQWITEMVTNLDIPIGSCNNISVELVKFIYENPDFNDILSNITENEKCGLFSILGTCTPEELQLHCTLLKNDNEYFNSNKLKGFPSIGSNEWASTLTFMDDEDGNAAEIALSVLYPLPALIFYNNKDEAYKMTKQKMGSNGHNNCSDAFRHAYYNAINTKSVTAGFAKLFADAHETSTPSSLALEKEMDLHNNDKGRTLGENNSSKSNNEIADLVITQLLNMGQLLHVSPLDLNSNITPTSILIPTSTGCK